MTTIKLWTDNRIDQEHEIELDHLAKRFVAWYQRHGAKDWNWMLERTIRMFITDHATEGGMQSVFDESDYDAIHEACRVEWRKLNNS